METKSSPEKVPLDGPDPAKEPLDDADWDHAAEANITGRLPDSKKKKKVTLLDLFKTPALVLRTLCIFYCWYVIAVAMIMIRNSTNMEGFALLPL